MNGVWTKVINTLKLNAGRKYKIKSRTCQWCHRIRYALFPLFPGWCDTVSKCLPSFATHLLFNGKHSRIWWCTNTAVFHTCSGSNFYFLFLPQHISKQGTRHTKLWSPGKSETNRRLMPCLHETRLREVNVISQ